MSKTEFEIIRQKVYEGMPPRLRHLWAKAIAQEEANRHASGELYYAWNRVLRAIDDAQHLESEYQEDADDVG